MIFCISFLIGVMGLVLKTLTHDTMWKRQQHLYVYYGAGIFSVVTGIFFLCSAVAGDGWKAQALVVCHGFVLAALLLWLTPGRHAHTAFEVCVHFLLKTATGGVCFLGIAIVGLLAKETWDFLHIIPLRSLLSSVWDPHITPEGIWKNFGLFPLLAGTLLITLIGILVAGPFSLAVALYLSHYVKKKTWIIISPLLEILASIPTVAYGFIGAMFIGPWLSRVGARWGLTITVESALAGGLVMGVMLIPFVTCACEEIFRSFPKSLKESAVALGSTSFEVLWRVVFLGCLPQVIGVFLLAVSRAIGETMLIMMMTGMTARLTLNPFHSTTTITTQIVSLLTGDQEPESPKTLASFALGLLLFVITFFLNTVVLRRIRKHPKLL